MDRRFVGRLYTRVLHKYFLRDLWFDLQLEAKREAVDYIKAHLRDAAPRRDRDDLLDFAAERARAEGLNGLVCEFGVSGGKSIRRLAGAFPQVHGFDSFKGLPEDWSGTRETRGRFSQKGRLPKVPANARLHPGWFEQSLPPFLQAHPGPASLLHLDADLYSSTKTVLTLMTPRIRPGTVPLFDEYLGYWNWRAHEYRALQEWVRESGATYSYIGFNTSGGQVAVRVDTI
jgi:hypothetical protein